MTRRRGGSGTEVSVNPKWYPASVLYPQICFFVRDEHTFAPVTVLCYY